MSENIHSTGRGGAGNITNDTHTYVDGGIVREGEVGDQGDGAYSAGRGGAGNINSPNVKPVKGQAGDADVVPETAIRHPGEGPGYENYHTGRGGQGNVHKDDTDNKESLIDKVKDKVLHHKKEES
ncbi:uncharacterized protein KY384_008414 [Bacidia gigantensis]|uniref:uncharacterized protein n=1 Tax=Bacidia gigantensis TaxID=2732470 RepID=UPI001D055F8B|nr:uncharacterized protein KY384_008414 [Bacidia gigantensis]KAG8526985.1 hypothetical protein KY384_008414 [Bacidia gigantensis]